MGMMDFVKTQEWTTGPLTLDEMIKLFSIIDSPETADNVRKALRFYEAPDTVKAQWKEVGEILERLKVYDCSLPKEVVDELLNLVKGSKAVLIVGAGFGGLMKRIVSVMPKGSLVVAVENPQDDYRNQKASLKEICRQSSVLGARVELFLGDSKAQKLIQAIEGYAPYDFALVAKGRGEEQYGPMAKVMGIVDDSGIEIVYRE